MNNETSRRVNASLIDTTDPSIAPGVPVRPSIRSLLSLVALAVYVAALGFAVHFAFAWAT